MIVDNPIFSVDENKITDDFMAPLEVEIVDGDVRVNKTSAELSEIINRYIHGFTANNAFFDEENATVFWNDGTKTVVKCDPDDTYSKEAGVAFCFMKKALGNKGNYNQALKRLTGQD